MFSQLLIVRLKAAENALRDGQLDEAYRLATAPDLREHRRGRAVLAALTERLIERAREHYRADRCAEALIDLDKAEAGEVMKEQIAELRSQVRTVAAELQRMARARRERIDTARRRIEGGSLAAGRRILGRAEQDDHTACELHEHANDREEDALNLAKLTDNLMRQGQFAAAAERIRRAKSLDPHQEVTVRVETQLCNRVFDKARTAIVDGRLGRAADELACLGGLGDKLPAKRELTDLLGLARQAAKALEVHQYGEARRHTLSLARLLPKAKWVSQTGERLRHLDELRTELGAGPLGEAIDATLSGKARGARVATSANRPASQDDTVALPHRAAAGASLPDRLLLLVDGGGSFLLLRDSQTSIGRAASDDPADIPILSDIAERHADVSRVDDDYFVFSVKEVEIGGQKTKHRLLRDGDRVVLGRKAKLTFRVPSRRSATAVLDLSDTTKMPNDVRRVILFDRHATLGRGPKAHVYCRHAGCPLIIFERNGSLWVRPQSDGRVDTSAQELRLGEPIEMAGASFVLERWQMRTPGGKTV